MPENKIKLVGNDPEDVPVTVVLTNEDESGVSVAVLFGDLEGVLTLDPFLQSDVPICTPGVT